LPVLRTRNFHQFTVIRAVVKNYFQLFFRRQRPQFHKERGGENILNQNSRKCFLYFFPLIFRASNRTGFRPRKPTEKTGMGTSNSARVRLFAPVEESSSGDNIRIVLSHDISMRCKAATVRGYG
jgi:hypothetical protein